MPQPAGPVLGLLLLTAHAAVSAPSPASPVQAKVMADLQASAAAASSAATPLVLEAFDDPQFRQMLKQALPPGATTLDPIVPASELLERFRLEVGVAEPVHSFRGVGSSPTQMSLTEAMNASGADNLWQLALTSPAGKPNADHAGFGGMNAAEVGLFSFPAFTGERTNDPAWAAKVWPGSEKEAADRPLYSSFNLRKVDGGNDIFGPVGMVWRTKTMRDRTILTPVDTGCFEYLCNASWASELCTAFTDPETCNGAWTRQECRWDPVPDAPGVPLGPGLGVPGWDPVPGTGGACHVAITRGTEHAAVNCSQWGDTPAKTFAGTLDHFDHLILPGPWWWNGSTPTTWRENLVGQMTRMFRKWPATVNQSGGCWSQPDFTPATSVENFWEAEVLSPRYSSAAVPRGDVKMILGEFDRFYGTAGGTQLRAWCKKNGWALIWALGPGWPAGAACGDIPDLPSNQRFLDPEASGTAGYNLSLPVLAARQAADATWQRLSRADRPTGNMSAVREIWGALRGSLPKGYLVEPLYGLSCGDTDSCIGIVEGSSDCVCYKP